MENDAHDPLTSVPWFGARKLARQLLVELQRLRPLADENDRLRFEHDRIREQLRTLGAFTVVELEARRSELDREISLQALQLAQEREAATAAVQAVQSELQKVQQAVVTTEDVALLQEAGVYQYRHPLTDAVAFQEKLSAVQDEMKAMTRKDGGAVLATTSWTVNGSEAQGRTMVRDFSKLMLRAFNAEADNLVRGLKPYKMKAAIERLRKVADTIERLGRSMNIRISTPYLQLRVRELELTADFLQKQAEEKEAERVERERLREERKVQQEIERERVRLEKERQHYANALEALTIKGDEAGVARLQAQLADVQRAIEDVDYRAANIRAGYVYVISNIGSFGENLVKVGMTRRLDPADRIRELSDASVPFNFDIHALFFSKDAVGIESAMHARLATVRVNVVNRRREFFRATPLEMKAHLADLAGELLQYEDVPEALEFRQSLAQARVGVGASPPGVAVLPTAGARALDTPVLVGEDLRH
jgi:Domain of unknown function (DUF4041)/T5orf172 domain